MKAILKTYRQSPRKVRLLADLIRGKRVELALQALSFADKRGAPIFEKVLRSAIANAKNNQAINEADLFVKDATVNAGATLKRFMPRARGSSARINKRTSHITVILGVKEVEAPKVKKSKTEKISKKPKAVKASK